MFENSGEGDYRLAAGSLLEDAGVVIPGLNDSFTGNGPDVEAFERVAGIPTATPPCIHHGDVDFSGDLTAGDAQLAFFFALAIVTPSYEEGCAIDHVSVSFQHPL